MARLGYRHQRVQRLRRLSGRRSARQSEGCFVIEGAKVLSEALDAGLVLESVYVDPSLRTDHDDLDALVERVLASGSRVFELDDGVLERVSDTSTPQPVIGVANAIDISLAELGQNRPDFVTVCVEVRDPGNAGTIVRSSGAAGAKGVIFCDGSVEVFNPKTVRASAGSLFWVPVVSGGSPTEVLDELRTWGLLRVGTAVEGGDDYCRLDLTQPVAVVVGSEADGLPDELSEHLDVVVTIPMTGRSESINVGMAAAVMSFEVARQRRSAGDAVTGAIVGAP